MRPFVSDAPLAAMIVDIVLRVIVSAFLGIMLFSVFLLADEISAKTGLMGTADERAKSALGIFVIGFVLSIAMIWI